jgi:C4-dicarboxylate-specific signal transduction histidine kinase
MALAARVYEEDRTLRTRRTGKRAQRVRFRIAGKGARIALLAAIPLALVLAYVGLTAQLTAQTYRLHDDQARQTALAQRDNELRQQVARLESLPRLEAAAAKLHMTVPGGIALVAPARSAIQPAPQTALAFLADVRKWFGIR